MLPRGSEPRVFSVRPGREGFTFRVGNHSKVPVRVKAGGVFVRAVSIDRRTGRRILSHITVVSVRRTAKPGRSVSASAYCPTGSAAIASFLDLPVPQLEGTSSVQGRRGFTFTVFNNSDSARRVRLLGSCLSEEVR